MITLNLSRKEIGDVPSFKFDNCSDAFIKAKEFVFSTDLDNNVLIVFEDHYLDEGYRNGIRSILISFDETSIMPFIDDVLDKIGFREINLCIFEMATFKEAYDFCQDLTEGY